MVKHSKSSCKQRRNDVNASLTGVRSDAWVLLLDLVWWDAGVMQHAHDRGWVLDLKQVSSDHHNGGVSHLIGEEIFWQIQSQGEEREE